MCCSGEKPLTGSRQRGHGQGRVTWWWTRPSSRLDENTGHNTRHAGASRQQSRVTAGTCFQAMHMRVNPRRWWDGRSDRLPPWAATETAEPGPWAKPPPAASGKVRVCDRAQCSVPAETLPSGARGSGLRPALVPEAEVAGATRWLSGGRAWQVPMDVQSGCW